MLRPTQQQTSAFRYWWSVKIQSLESVEHFFNMADDMPAVWSLLSAE